MTMPASARRLRVDVGHARRRQRPDEQHVHAHRKDAGRDGVFEHVAGKPRVLADDDLVPAAAARLAFEVFENVRGGAAQFERGLGGDGFNVGRAADAVRAEDFFGGTHGFFSGGGGTITSTLGGSTLTSVTPGGAETSTGSCKSRSSPMSVRLTTA